MSEAQRQEEHDEKGHYECISCGALLPTEGTTPFDDCDHERDICPACLERWIETQLSSTIVEEGVRCPSACQRILTYEDLRGAISPALHARLEAHVLRATLRRTPGYRECMREGCESGQFHDNGSNGPVFCCDACGFLICTVHNVPYHNGETCAQYDERMKKHSIDEEASKKEVGRISRPCPGCGMNIQKISGCDHVTCIKCGYIFCFPCGAQIVGWGGVDAVAITAHASGCPHHGEVFPGDEVHLQLVHLVGGDEDDLARDHEHEVLEQRIRTLQARLRQPVGYTQPRGGDFVIDNGRYLSATPITQPDPSRLAQLGEHYLGPAMLHRQPPTPGDGTEQRAGHSYRSYEDRQRPRARDNHGYRRYEDRHPRAGNDHGYRSYEDRQHLRAYNDHSYRSYLDRQHPRAPNDHGYQGYQDRHPRPRNDRNTTTGPFRWPHPVNGEGFRNANRGPARLGEIWPPANSPLRYPNTIDLRRHNVNSQSSVPNGEPWRGHRSRRSRNPSPTFEGL